MKLYRRHVAITEKDEMHLEVDHHLEPVEIDEEKIAAILSMYEKTYDSVKQEFRPLDVFQKNKVEGAAKAIMNLINNK